MATPANGIRLRENSIQIWFNYQGARRWETLRIPPTPANIKYAIKIRAEITGKIKMGIFDYADYFPESKHAAAESVQTFEAVANLWLQASANLAESTLSGYRKMLNQHVLPAIGSLPIDAIKYSQSVILTKWLK